jgi:hypothetical protein
MKKLRQTLSLAFATLVFISSSSFSFGMHRCGGEVRDVAFLSQADGCGHQQLPPCHRKIMAGCCADEKLSYEGQGFDVSQTLTFISLDAGHFTQPAISIAEIITNINSNHSSFTYYDPPLRSSDHIIINQVFRI